MVETIGFFAGACMLGAILLRNIYAIKVLLLVASLSFMTYGIILHLLPIITINAVLSVSGTFELVRLIRKKKTSEK